MNQNRVVYLQQLNNFITSTKDRLNYILDTINWKKGTLQCSKEIQSSDSNHGAENSERANPNELHIEGIPDIGQVNISKQDLLYGILQTISFLLRNLGLNSETSGSGQLYNEIVASLQQAEQPVNSGTKDVKAEDKAAALVQQMKLERDAKRRRISYKNKVHTKNKSHIEVLREVLGEQMLTLTEGQTNKTLSTNSGDQKVPNQVPELIAIQQPPGNPHLAWLTVIKEDEIEKSRTIHECRLQKDKSIHSRHRRQATYYQPSFKGEENRKDHIKNSSRKEKEWKKEGYDRHREKKEGNGRYRDKAKVNDRFRDEEECNERHRFKKKGYGRHRDEGEGNEKQRNKKKGYDKQCGEERRYDRHRKEEECNDRHQAEEEDNERYRDKEEGTDRRSDEEEENEKHSCEEERTDRNRDEEYGNDRCSNEEESNDRYSDKEKEMMNVLEERKRKHSPNSDERRRHKKKKYKTSRSRSPGDYASEYKKHRSKHKKKKH